jgi:hypothetical protein
MLEHGQSISYTQKSVNTVTPQFNGLIGGEVSVTYESVFKNPYKIPHIIEVVI